MKRLKSRSRLAKLHSFTLVELLVVMGIIAILASVLVVSAGSIIRQAKRAKFNATATSIQTSVLNYYTEYSVYPVPPNTTTDFLIDDTDSAGNWKNLILCLSGNINPLTGASDTSSTITNSRAIAFLSLKKADVYDSTATTKVAPINPLPPDTNHKYMNIAMDGNYDGVIGTDGAVAMPNFSGSFATTGGSTTQGVAVWANCNGSTTSTNANFWVHTY